MVLSVVVGIGVIVASFMGSGGVSRVVSGCLPWEFLVRLGCVPDLDYFFVAYTIGVVVVGDECGVGLEACGGVVDVGEVLCGVVGPA